jgi:hypothetical protein
MQFWSELCAAKGDLFNTDKPEGPQRFLPSRLPHGHKP